MSNAMDMDKQVYRVEGFSCVNCAGKFEKNVKNIPGVRDAKVNFGASKLAVYGEATVEELEKAGSFENLKVIPENSTNDAGQGNTAKTDKKPSYKKHSQLLSACLFIVFGYISHACKWGR